jgi:hypothetical protein
LRRWQRFERIRYRLYLSLLVFVVVAGLPILGIPALRHRLAERVQLLKEAAGAEGRPVSLLAKVGENRDPFPEEYEIPVLKHQLPPAVIDMTDRVYTTSPGVRIVPGTSEPLYAPPGSETPGSDAAASASAEPEYRQGKIEQEAYDLLMKSSDTVAGMVQGKDAALRFKSWAAARMEDDVFLVRLIFTLASDKSDVPYIWQVKVVSKQVTPLNYHARSLPK